MNKTNKKLICAVLTVVSLLLMSTMVFATGEILGEIDSKGEIEDSGIKDMIGTIVGIVQQFATASAIGMLLYVGIKYTMASANEKADLKNSSIKYLAGAIIVFAATGLFTLVETLMEEVGSDL